MRDIRRIYIHHSAGPREQTVESIAAFHVRPKDQGGRGWDAIGYHFVIDGAGLLHAGRDVAVVGAHAKGDNTHSVGVCVVGDNTTPGREWTDKQKKVLAAFVACLRIQFPGAAVLPHHANQNTACPGITADELSAILSP